MALVIGFGCSLVTIFQCQQSNKVNKALKDIFLLEREICA